MSTRTFVKRVDGYQCDICGKEIDHDDHRNGSWQNLLSGGELPEVNKKTALRFLFFINQGKGKNYITYHFHPECFASNIKKIFPKAKDS